MDLIQKNELDPLFEILSLLYLCHNANWKEEAIQSLDEYGVKGEEFFRAEGFSEDSSGRMVLPTSSIVKICKGS